MYLNIYLALTSFLPGNRFSSQRAQVRSGVPIGFQMPHRNCGTALSLLWPPPYPPVWLPPPAQGLSLRFSCPFQKKVTLRWFHGQLSQERPKRCGQCRCQNPRWCPHCRVAGIPLPLSPLAKSTQWIKQNHCLVHQTILRYFNWFSSDRRYQMNHWKIFLVVKKHNMIMNRL